ncbi:MAG: alpha/beta hydrolase [bacterium]|nr:alpha/beta hydrolase [bacterium]
MRNIKVIFIPGNGGGSTKGNWFPYVERELQKLGVQVIAAEFPDPMLARAKYWLPFLKELGVDENTILIGHSSGAEAAMRFTEKNKIFGSVLVSPCHTDLNIEEEKISGYYDEPWDWESIKTNQQFIIQFSSINDPFIPIEEALFVSQKLGTEYYEMNNGHFYPQEEFRELVEAIKTYIHH